MTTTWIWANCRRICGPTRLPSALRDRAPRIEERDGQAVWICDGKVWGSWGGKPPSTGNQRPVKPLYNSFDRAGIYDQSARRPAVAELRLADMDRDGVETQVIFGPIFQISTDDPVLRECLLPRLQRLALGLLQGGARSADRRADAAGDARRRQPTELLRLAAKGGVRQVTLMIANINPKLDDPAWETLWTALEDTGIILSWHITVFVGNPSDARRRQGRERVREHQILSWGISSSRLSICSPGASSNAIRSCKIVIAEAGTGWLPWLVAGARLPPLAALGGQGVLGRQGRQPSSKPSPANCSNDRSGRPSRKTARRCR